MMFVARGKYLKERRLAWRTSNLLGRALQLTLVYTLWLDLHGGVRMSDMTSAGRGKETWNCQRHANKNYTASPMPKLTTRKSWYEHTRLRNELQVCSQKGRKSRETCCSFISQYLHLPLYIPPKISFCTLLYRQISRRYFAPTI